MDTVGIVIIIIFLVIAVPVFILTKINKEKMKEFKEAQNKKFNRRKKHKWIN